jgi:SAM-dependent methyltransferase
MAANDTSAIGAFFGDKWPLYQRAIQSDVLCHADMFGILDRLLSTRFNGNPFRFVDFGCGDASAVLKMLQTKNVTHYTGVDASSDLLASAARNLAPLKCQKTLICNNMAIAVDDLSGPSDIFLCSYSLHHLVREEKAKFIETCYRKLNSPGHLVLIDGVAKENETRDQWLGRLEKRLFDKGPDFTAEDVAQLMVHPREFDYPETVETFRRMSGHVPWKSFDVLMERDEFLAFMLFSK